MEEPPKIERIISSQGISLSDASVILKKYISEIDLHHLHHETPAPAPTTPVKKEADEHDDAKPKVEEGTDDKEKKPATPARKTRQELEEERLIAQMDKLADGTSSSGLISDDVYERLKMITESICAEVEGRSLSASAASRAAASKKENGEEHEMNIGPGAEPTEEGAEEILADFAEAERQQQQEEAAKEQRTAQSKSKRDKKKEKKAKKAAKKAKKEAKRKAKHGGVDRLSGGNSAT